MEPLLLNICAMQPKKLTFAIDTQNTDEGIKRLLQQVKPNWKWDNVEQNVLSGGYSCIMLRLYDKSNRDDSVTVRIRNLLSHLADDQQKFEVKMLALLSDTGIFTDLLATFENGYCYQYIKGQPVVNLKTGEIILTDSILKAVAKKIVKVHTMKVSGVDYSDSKYFELFSKMVENSEYQPPDSRYSTKDDLTNEYEGLKRFLINLNTPMGLCHGDLHLGNMVWNQMTENITFVDWELIHVGWLYTDIVHFTGLVTTLWCESLSNISSNFNRDDIPNDFPDKFYKFYYDEWLKYHKKAFVQKEFDSFKSTVEKFKLCDALMFLLGVLCLSEEKTAGFITDVTKYRDRNMEIYLGLKKKHCGIDKFGFPETNQNNGLIAE